MLPNCWVPLCLHPLTHKDQIRCANIHREGACLWGQPLPHLKRTEPKRSTISGVILYLFLHSSKQNDHIWLAKCGTKFDVSVHREGACFRGSATPPSEEDGAQASSGKSTDGVQVCFLRLANKNTNRKPYPVYRMVPLSMILSDLGTLTGISRSRYFSTLNISETT